MKVAVPGGEQNGSCLAGYPAGTPCGKDLHRDAAEHRPVREPERPHATERTRSTAHPPAHDLPVPARITPGGHANNRPSILLGKMNWRAPPGRPVDQLVPFQSRPAVRQRVMKRRLHAYWRRGRMRRRAATHRPDPKCNEGPSEEEGREQTYQGHQAHQQGVLNEETARRDDPARSIAPGGNATIAPRRPCRGSRIRPTPLRGVDAVRCPGQAPTIGASVLEVRRWRIHS